jgi:hypothetical protein
MKNNAMFIPVISISRPIWEELELLTSEAVLIGMFERAVNLLIGESILTLVLPELQNGPFHLVVPLLPDLRITPLSLKNLPKGLQIGDVLLNISSTTRIWEPKPNWESVVLHSDMLTTIKDYILAEILPKKQFSASPFGELFKGDDIPLLANLWQGLCSSDEARLATAVSKIAGLGPGLTPSGDDFLSGVMLAIHALKEPPGGLPGVELCRRIYETAAGRTTHLSRAFLQSAASGLCDERWHRFLDAISAGDRSELQDSLRCILSFGATSGFDTLSGFLWMFETALNSP